MALLGVQDVAGLSFDLPAAIRATFEAGGIPALTDLLKRALDGSNVMVTFRDKAAHQAAARDAMRVKRLSGKGGK